MQMMSINILTYGQLLIPIMMKENRFKLLLHGDHAQEKILKMSMLDLFGTSIIGRVMVDKLKNLIKIS